MRGEVKREAKSIAIDRIMDELDAIADFYEHLDEAPIVQALRHEKRAERFATENQATVALCRELMEGLRVQQPNHLPKWRATKPKRKKR